MKNIKKTVKDYRIEPKAILFIGKDNANGFMFTYIRHNIQNEFGNDNLDTFLDKKIKSEQEQLSLA